MNKLTIQLAAIQGNLAVHQAYVTYFQTRIQTGVYKTRKRYHGGFDGPLFTEEELLADEIQVMHRHIQLMQECIDAMHDIGAELPS
jgi:hypothetical protein